MLRSVRRRLKILSLLREITSWKAKRFHLGIGAKRLPSFNKLEAQSEAPSKEKFLVSLLQIAAFARNAHDSLRFGEADAWRPQDKLPFRIIWFPDGMIIARAGPEYGELLGANVTSIEGLSIDELLVRFAKRPVASMVTKDGIQFGSLRMLVCFAHSAWRRRPIDFDSVWFCAIVATLGVRSRFFPKLPCLSGWVRYVFGRVN